MSSRLPHVSALLDPLFTERAEGERSVAYAVWIADWETRCATSVVGTPCVATGVRGTCSQATVAMVEAFPELRRVRGHYDGHEHWWCVAPDGSVVDPTAAQFCPGGTYVEHVGPEPVGKCHYCGSYVWTPYRGCPEACSKECYDGLAAEYNFARYTPKAVTHD